MGPYCEYCRNRCFVRVLGDWPETIREAYGRYSIAATCHRGQAYELDTIGYSYDDVKAAPVHSVSGTKSVRARRVEHAQ